MFLVLILIATLTLMGPDSVEAKLKTLFLSVFCPPVK